MNNCNGNCNNSEQNEFLANMHNLTQFQMEQLANDFNQSQNNENHQQFIQQQQQQQQQQNSENQLATSVSNTPEQPVQKNRSVNMSRKRTFANMVWPMDPEEEKILRSNSPFIVPEIIVQRNEAVKSILKKNNNLINNSSFNNYTTLNSNLNNNNSNNSILSTSPSPRASTEINLNNLIIGGTNNYGKKKVDFHENFLFVNVFDKNADEDMNSATS